MNNNFNNKHQETPRTMMKQLEAFLKKQMVKLGNVLVKLGKDESPQYLQETSAVSADTGIVVGGCSELQPVGNDNDLREKSDNIPSYDVPSMSSTNVDPSISGKKFVRNASDLIKEYDRHAAETNDKGIRLLYSDAATKMIENLILSGCTCINPQENEPFDFNRHVSHPFSLSTDKQIEKTLRLGVALGDEVLIKAIVKLK